MNRQATSLTQFFFILTVSCGLTACSNQTVDNSSTEIAFSKLDIPKHWTEIKKQDSEWIYSIPCHNFRELQTVDISNTDNIPSVSCNFGTDGQWFAIQNIRQQADSLVFTTVLPYDSSSTVLMSMKYLDKEKNITRWITDGVVCTYIPTEDTIKYKRVIEPCD